MNLDILDLLTQDHDEVLELVASLEKIAETATKRAEVAKLAARLASAVRVHSKCEERALYEACRAKSESLRDMALEGYVEHQTLDGLLDRLAALTPGKDGELAAVLKVIKDMLVHHAREEEEKEMFPKVRRAFSKEERADMGRDLMLEKKRLLVDLKRAA